MDSTGHSLDLGALGLDGLALDEGAHSCVLYTDAANPTSNAIYQAIGYRPRYAASARVQP